jgi:hypothetical protein
MGLEPDTFLTVAVLAEAAVIDEARKQSARFLNSESPRNVDVPEKMLPVALSPTGKTPATHFCCTRRMTPAEIDRQATAIRDYPVPVTALVVESEDVFLASTGLKRIER